jgi:predicted transcriptional regulator
LRFAKRQAKIFQPARKTRKLQKKKFGPFTKREQAKIFFSVLSQNANGPKYFFPSFHKTRTGQNIFFRPFTKRERAKIFFSVLSQNANGPK